MTTTDSSTRCWRNPPFSPLLAWVLALGVLFYATTVGPAQAQPTNGSGTQITQFEVEREDGELLLSATVQFELSTLVEDALLKGIPMFFMAEAVLTRDRWYWTDQKVATEARHMRLAYQPLTRRWRLNVGSHPLGGNVGMGVTLAQSFDTLHQALSAIQRFARWHIAGARQLDAGANYTLRFRFALDVSQLPRPLQIGAVGQSEWDIAVSRSQRLPAEGGK